MKINPCKACMEKLKSGNCDINNINQCCYDTVAAFTNSISNNTFRDTPDAQNCRECVARQIQAEGKIPGCDLKIDPPPIWSQVPHYFPDALEQMGDKQKALASCHQQCKSNFVYPNECRQNCETDAAAVEGFEITSSSCSSFLLVLFAIFAFLILLILIMRNKKCSR